MEKIYIAAEAQGYYNYDDYNYGEYPIKPQVLKEKDYPVEHS